MEQNAKILLVDDDAEIREVIRILLESEGCEIVEAEPVEWLAKRPMMPAMSRFASA